MRPPRAEAVIPDPRPRSSQRFPDRGEKLRKKQPKHFWAGIRWAFLRSPSDLQWTLDSARKKHASVFLVASRWVHRLCSPPPRPGGVVGPYGKHRSASFPSACGTAGRSAGPGNRSAKGRAPSSGPEWSRFRPPDHRRLGAHKGAGSTKGHRRCRFICSKGHGSNPLDHDAHPVLIRGPGRDSRVHRRCALAGRVGMGRPQRTNRGRWSRRGAQDRAKFGHGEPGSHEMGRCRHQRH